MVVRNNHCHYVSPYHEILRDCISYGEYDKLCPFVLQCYLLA